MLRILIIILLGIIIIISNPFSYSGYRPQTGDLLFQDLDCGPLCDAIKRENNTTGQYAFSHVGMLIWQGTTPYVIEAYGMVKLTPLMEFLSRTKTKSGCPNVLVMRPKEKFRQEKYELMQTALQFVGKPYDTEFLMTNDAYYCSELIYDIYTKVSGDSNYFSLHPMQFSTNGYSVDTVWINYFKKIGKKIPLGQPGCNPTQMAQSKKLEVVYNFSQY